MQEYEQQGRVETERALRELREHCRSSGMWDTISNLENPKRCVRLSVCLSVCLSAKYAQKQGDTHTHMHTHTHTQVH